MNKKVRKPELHARIKGCLIKHPDWSNRRIGKYCGTSNHDMVVDWREHLEGNKTIPYIPILVGSDGRSVYRDKNSRDAVQSIFPEDEPTIIVETGMMRLQDGSQVDIMEHRNALMIYEEPLPPEKHPVNRYIQFGDYSQSYKESCFDALNKVACEMLGFNDWKDPSMKWHRVDAELAELMFLFLKDHAKGKTGKQMIRDSASGYWTHVKGVLRQARKDGHMGELDWMRIEDLKMKQSIDEKDKSKQAPVVSPEVWMRFHRMLKGDAPRTRMLRAFLVCLFPLGCRPSDAGNLKHYELDVDEMIINCFRPKTGFEAPIMLDDFPNTRQILADWMLSIPDGIDDTWFKTKPGPQPRVNGVRVGEISWDTPYDNWRKAASGLAQQILRYRETLGMKSRNWIPKSGRESFRTYSTWAEVGEFYIHLQGGWRMAGASYTYADISNYKRRYGAFANVPELQEFDAMLADVL